MTLRKSLVSGASSKSGHLLVSYAPSQLVLVSKGKLDGISWAPNLKSLKGFEVKCKPLHT